MIFLISTKNKVNIIFPFSKMSYLTVDMMYRHLPTTHLIIISTYNTLDYYILENLVRLLTILLKTKYFLPDAALTGM